MRLLHAGASAARRRALTARLCNGTSLLARATSPSCLAGAARRRLASSSTARASVRAKVEHPFRVIKRQFGLAKVRFRGLAKNTAHVITLFALSNLWMARKKLIAMAVLRPQTA